MDVVGIGNLNWDRLLFTDKLAERGGESPINQIEESAGGSAYNTISWLSKYNLQLGFIGAVGKDPEAKSIFKNLIENDIDHSQIQKKPGRTGCAYSIVDSDGDRTLYTYGGVGSHIDYNKINQKYLTKPKLIHISSFLDQKGHKFTKKILETDNQFSYNPGPLCREQGLEKLKPILKKINILFLSKKELEDLTGDKTNKAHQKLLKIGVEKVVVTLGSQGSTVHTRQKSYKAPAKDIKIVDATGAGDAFAAGYIKAYINNKNPEKCLKEGNKIAAECLQKTGGSYKPKNDK
ncbi:Sugar kinase ribokinase family [Methanonatronarchaeum thermophilum]|uniref:Sugar kinase ribokinase family n=1 Tax=Methanonatronarchaeum thermophilum TaxID=1927129 RepID=A0A1Y3GHU5_9EURY|nr:PfkB family carbohydrate kinase [Methanonatronarchaeum thermophilum]OUJ19005.1 Sugar kinase ribokinase family [Methanonatronarchaeum thermophilum]